MNLSKKIRSQSGFSLAETLLAVLILLLVTSLVTTGISTVQNVYDKVVLGANAQVMLSTAVTALRDEFGTAYSIEKPATADADELYYYNAGTGARTKLSKNEETEAAQLTTYAYDNDPLLHDKITDGAQAQVRNLVSDTNTDLYVTYDTIACGENTVTVNDIKVCKKVGNKVTAGGTTDADKVNITIRVLSEAPAAEG